MNQGTGTGDTQSTGGQSPLDRAAAAPPIDWDEPGDVDPGASNQEPEYTHDSPAAVEEERADEPNADLDNVERPDRLSDIYSPPPGRFLDSSTD